MYLYFSHLQVAFVQSDLRQDTIKLIALNYMMQLSEQSCGGLIKWDIKRRERESRDEKGGDKSYAIESRISQMSWVFKIFLKVERVAPALTELCRSLHHQEKRGVWIVVSEQAALPDNHHVRNTAEEGQMGSNKAVVVRRANPVDSP